MTRAPINTVVQGTTRTPRSGRWPNLTPAYAAAVTALLVAAVAAVWLTHPGHTVAHGAGAAHRAAITPGRSPSSFTGHAPRPVTGGQTISPFPQRLSLQELAGQRIVYAYAGLEPPASLLSAIRSGAAGGVIFFGDNVSSPGQLRAVIGELQRASRASPAHTRLLMLTDQEGGQVRRLPGPPTLSEKQIGQLANGATAARAAGSGAGQNLRAAGINVNLAPVLDVYRRPRNFIDQFQRSYSDDPARVAALGAAFVAAQQRTGVAATGKHFPGLGSAAQSQNTDARTVVVGLPPTALRSVDEAPYRGAIAAGVKLVMMSWAIYPALDPRLPAGLSPAVIGAELRRRLGFHGVTITDAIDAGALTQFGTLSRRAVLAASAGADLILCAEPDPSKNTPAEGIIATRAIASAIRHRQISLTAAQQAAARILTLRANP